MKWRRLLAFAGLLLLLSACTPSQSQAPATTEPSALAATPPEVPRLPDSESTAPIQENMPMNENILYITAGTTTFSAALAENSSAQALKELLADGPITLALHDYGNFEKVGALGHTLPRNDEPITTEPGDIILYQGSNITIYYDENTWNFTRLGKIESVTRETLLDAFGDGSVDVTFSLTRPESIK